MARSRTPKATLIIAGPGAGKTHNMVNEIISNLPDLSPCRYMAVITHTNAATNNIKTRVSQKITIPPNLFIGTIHSFLNKFIVIPYSSFHDNDIPRDKLFMQFGTDKAYAHIEKNLPANKKPADFKAKAQLKNQISDSLKNKGYITFDQTLSLSRDSMSVDHIAAQVSNRLQFLFVDEFQDAGNEVYSILEVLRKIGRTKIYCVGDPEQYIQSFDSPIRAFTNIPILKAAINSRYDVQLNNNNFRCSQTIIDLLNKFNGREFGGVRFFQELKEKRQHTISSPLKNEHVYFIKSGTDTVQPIIDRFYAICNDEDIPIEDRCLLAKQDSVVNRIITAVNQRYKNPKKNGNISAINVIRDTVLYMLSLNNEEFCQQHKKTAHDLRKLAVELFHAIRLNEITNENEFGVYLRDKHDLIVNRGMLVKIDDMKIGSAVDNSNGVVTIANIHTIKGLEHPAVLVIARNEQELLKWVQVDRGLRDNDTEDVCRIGYVAFSRAEKLLCIGCLTSISQETEKLIASLGIKLV